MEKTIKYYTATNHKKLDVLQKLVGKRQHAVVLDQFLFWSINSTFTLPKTNQIERWFCRTYENMAKFLDVSESVLYRLVRKFESMGLIERVKKKLMGDTRACFRATQKLINIAAGIAHAQPPITQKEEPKHAKECAQNKQKDSCTTVKTTVSPYKEYNYSEAISNITLEKFSPDVDNSLKQYKAIFAEVGERLLPEQKQYIARTVENLKSQRNVKFSMPPQEMFAQLVFSVLNKSCIPTAKTLEHRINVFAKKIREGLWRTPKGFYKYWDIGKRLHEKLLLKEKKDHLEKEELKGWEIKQLTDELKAKKSELRTQLSCTRGDIKQLPMLMKNDPVMLKKTLEQAKTKEAELLAELNLVATKVKDLNGRKLNNAERPIYEQYDCE